jgi:hypothetical protein
MFLDIFFLSLPAHTHLINLFICFTMTERLDLYKFIFWRKPRLKSCLKRVEMHPILWGRFILFQILISYINGRYIEFYYSNIAIIISQHIKLRIDAFGFHLFPHGISSTF